MHPHAQSHPHPHLPARGMSTSSASSSASQAGVPRVGGVRCYWSLLAPRFPNPSVPGSKLDLVFVHPDPVLAVHLARQRLSLMGRGVFEFIHPGEREQARRDLSSAISADDLQGSVTRVRFARLSWIRKILGGKPEEVEMPVDANMYVEDDEYLILDLVMNWVADGLLLAFFHAIKDKDAVQNNDPSNSQEEWSNYCGTANMPEDQIDALQQSIASYSKPPSPSLFPPSRVFQIHTSPSSPTRPDSLVVSWPPPRPPGAHGHLDGLYDALEYRDLMQGVDMDPNQHQCLPGETRTNCTTRFGAAHSVTTEGVYRHVNSVFIIYGSLVFACFQSTKTVELEQPQLSQPPIASVEHSLPGGVQQMYGLITPQQEWTLSPTDWSRSSAMPKTELTYHQPPPLVSPLQASYAHEYPQQQQQQQQQHPYQMNPTPPTMHDPPRYYDEPQDVSPNGQLSGDNSPPMQANGAQGRPLVRPPGSVDCCRLCGLKESPEWRRSETGIKDLCNACGLRLARQVAKREGRQKPRKKKDRAG